MRILKTFQEHRIFDQKEKFDASILSQLAARNKPIPNYWKTRGAGLRTYVPQSTEDIVQLFTPPTVAFLKTALREEIFIGEEAKRNFVKVQQCIPRSTYGLRWTCPKCRDLDIDVFNVITRTRTGFKDVESIMNNCLKKLASLDDNFSKCKYLEQPELLPHKVSRSLAASVTSIVSVDLTTEKMSTDCAGNALAVASSGISGTPVYSVPDAKSNNNLNLINKVNNILEVVVNSPSSEVYIAPLDVPISSSPLPPVPVAQSNVGIVDSKLISLWIPNELNKRTSLNNEISNELEVIHQLLEKILNAIPMEFDAILDAIESLFPYYKRSSYISYIHNLLKLLEYKPIFAEYIIQLLMEKLTIVDVDAPRQEIEDLESGDDNQDSEGEEIYNEVIKKKIRCEGTTFTDSNTKGRADFNGIGLI
uniref:Uncharacterized protein n=1 Tax=Glossina pallidipes TaxID=7398 RepID=A0A1B0A7A0_GLOPL